MVWCRDSRDSMDRQKPKAVADHGRMVSTLDCTEINNTELFESVFFEKIFLKVFFFKNVFLK